jgi:hypothetical protein
MSTPSPSLAAAEMAVGAVRRAVVEGATAVAARRLCGARVNGCDTELLGTLDGCAGSNGTDKAGGGVDEWLVLVHQL